MIRSPQTEALILEAQAPKSVTAVQNGASLDTAKKYARALFLFLVDNAAGQQTACRVQESDNDSDWTNITGKLVTHDVTNDGKPASVEVNLETDGNLANHGGHVGRYVRCTMTPSDLDATLVAATCYLWPKGGARAVAQQVAALHVAAGN